MEALTFDQYSGELIIKNPIKKKVINKGYRLLKDIRKPSSNFMDIISKWAKDGTMEKGSKQEWTEMIDALHDTIAKKGEIFFKSSIFTKDGNPCLYPNNISIEVLSPQDKSLGLNIIFENDKLENWRDYLRRGYTLFQEGQFHEIETHEVTFEQRYIIPVLNERINNNEQKINEYFKNIHDLRKTIEKINIGHGANFLTKE